MATSLCCPETDAIILTMATRNFNTNTASRQSMASSGGAVKARQLVCLTILLSVFRFFVLVYTMMGVSVCPSTVPPPNYHPHLTFFGSSSPKLPGTDIHLWVLRLNSKRNWLNSPRIWPTRRTYCA
ncbi:hypothetical protein F5144DRAFT_315833 [Chaetomium tenue]|uniref:Uncharacterized protein n=1 Tax=Chaetomium tenue TaxID=1854479 RepID=A0ACB7P5V0_9PEZI|nr:hypothetical protein F5144DRAFT_315833 [Chaetomium globosum]